MQFNAKCLTKCKPRPQVFDNITSECKKRLKGIGYFKAEKSRKQGLAIIQPVDVMHEDTTEAESVCAFSALKGLSLSIAFTLNALCKVIVIVL